MRRVAAILVLLVTATFIAITVRAAQPAPDPGSVAATTPTRAVYAPLIVKPEQPTATQPLPTTTPTQGPGLPAIKNSGFELGHHDWVEIPGNALITQFPPSGVTPHAGQWLAWLGGSPNDDDELQQVITLPASQSLYLHFFDQIRAGDDIFDRFAVYVNDAIVVDEDIDLGTDTGGMWEERSASLAPYAGQTVTIRFLARIRNSVAGSVFLDDVSIKSNP